MADAQKQNRVRIELTEEQRQKIRAETGRDAAAIEFTAQELEERIAPMSLNFSRVEVE